MSGPTPADWRSARGPGDRHDPRRWLFGGLAALFVLIGLAIVLEVVFSLWRNQPPSWSPGAGGWNWVFGLVGIAIALWIVVWVVRLVFWGLSGGPAYGHYWRHYYRHYYPRGPFAPDPAVEIARERFARGEITQEQLDRILQQLGKGSGPLPP